MREKFNDLTVDELMAKKMELSGKMRNLRFEAVMGRIENPMEKRAIRRQISRLNTMISEYRNGIRKA
ncbi:hypothetical protein S1OALGB6SA_2198 [Olavius algarvensis spirochete endosymbiont]|uniref:50S ribosomal protein L29 n=1 Tax=Olavius algarvensis spirochete endosymbiont TaxID=260710 RepID=UPI000F2BC09C|nr:50S ribosomal protein L29 [Olavius algarvensis spirochete endosymbiont]VDB01098.1 hypothetical protein S1OALGB6SA_2198 [Olavius algarvensis spirochete endosymbiont]